MPRRNPLHTREEDRKTKIHGFSGGQWHLDLRHHLCGLLYHQSIRLHTRTQQPRYGSLPNQLALSHCVHSQPHPCTSFSHELFSSLQRNAKRQRQEDGSSHYDRHNSLLRFLPSCGHPGVSPGLFDQWWAFSECQLSVISQLQPDQSCCILRRQYLLSLVCFLRFPYYVLWMQE